MDPKTKDAALSRVASLIETVGKEYDTMDSRLLEMNGELLMLKNILINVILPEESHVLRNFARFNAEGTLSAWRDFLGSLLLLQHRLKDWGAEKVEKEEPKCCKLCTNVVTKTRRFETVKRGDTFSYGGRTYMRVQKFDVYIHSVCQYKTCNAIVLAPKKQKGKHGAFSSKTEVEVNEA